VAREDRAGLTPAGVHEAAQELRVRLIAATERVLDSGWYVLGPEVEAFEREFAEWCGASHAVGVASGTDALTLALQAVGVRAGDEVIVPANALPTAFGAAATGARVRFADVRADDLNLDPEDVAGLLTERTRAIVAVHLYGHPADVGGLAPLVDPERVAIIEDCAQAHGATLHGRPVGTAGAAAAWSFYPTKNLGAFGDGGAVTTSNADIAAQVRSLRQYGEERRYFSTRIGTNSRLDELQAAFLREKLPHLSGWVERRRAVAARYNAALDAADVVLPPRLPGVEHAFHLYPTQVERRDDVLAALREAGVPAGVHYPVGAHQQPAFAESGFERGLPVTEALCASLLSLPMHPYMEHGAVDRVVDELMQALALAPLSQVGPGSASRNSS
jgi:dTDP-4-amino-4,6-dideoxygalactose transaminase